MTYKENSKDFVFGSCGTDLKEEGHSLKCPSSFTVFATLFGGKKREYCFAFF
jgi:hypothetical protein